MIYWKVGISKDRENQVHGNDSLALFRVYNYNFGERVENKF